MVVGTEAALTMEWALQIAAPHLRIVPEKLWAAAHAQIASRAHTTTARPRDPKRAPGWYRVEVSTAKLRSMWDLHRWIARSGHENDRANVPSVSARTNILAHFPAVTRPYEGVLMLAPGACRASLP
jgi:hypothetical protein